MIRFRFSRLGATERQALRQIARELNFLPGQEIFKEGDLGDAIYVVKKGAVEISGLMAGIGVLTSWPALFTARRA